MMLLLRPRGAGELRGHRQQAALKDQRFRDFWRECIGIKAPAGLLELAKLIAELATKVRQGKEGALDELGEEVASALKEQRLKGKAGGG